ncbi:MAG: purine-nucleoside phosphorylase, partial [Lachnospiraceae bacterium]|nr:purine-nucleoside phosphorylase [Lachnospiraceae bacterium]
MKAKQKDQYERVAKACEAVRKVTDFVPKVALTLGSGLGDYADQIEVKSEIDYADIPDFPVSTVAGHAGRFVFGMVGKVPVVAMKGRVHFYEGYDIREVVMPVNLLRMLGAEILFLTNAAGGINPDFHAGDLMLIRDHISLFVRNPLIGPNEDRFGTRFPDMSHAYDPELSDTLRKVADKNGIPLREGIYCQLTGPSYETPAEIRMLH